MSEFAVQRLVAEILTAGTCHNFLTVAIAEFGIVRFRLLRSVLLERPAGTLLQCLDQFRIRWSLIMLDLRLELFSSAVQLIEMRLLIRGQTVVILFAFRQEVLRLFE